MKAKVVNFGSINIDHVYKVNHFVQPGETLSSLGLTTGLGGKGANQSAALARAGVDVAHIGRISKADQWALEMLASLNVKTDCISLIDGPSGHAIIQVDDKGENAIVLHGGANQGFQHSDLQQIFNELDSVEYLLMQNETNLLAQAFELAKQKGIKIVFNPAPMTDGIKDLPLQTLDTLIVNQGEAQALCGASSLDDIVQELKTMLPNVRIVITLGGEGALLISADGGISRSRVEAERIVDTTAAGDTFVGYFLAGLVAGLNEKDCLLRACQAGALAVTREGAISAIPALNELDT